jgi:hypothetical protein
MTFSCPSYPILLRVSYFTYSTYSIIHNNAERNRTMGQGQEPSPSSRIHGSRSYQRESIPSFDVIVNADRAERVEWRTASYHRWTGIDAVFLSPGRISESSQDPPTLLGSASGIARCNQKLTLIANPSEPNSALNSIPKAVLQRAKGKLDDLRPS